MIRRRNINNEKYKLDSLPNATPTRIPTAHQELLGTSNGLLVFI